jgi:hypothetical protein
MKTYYVKLNGTDMWFEVQAESSIEIANQLRAEGKSGKIRTSIPQEEPSMNENPKPIPQTTTGGDAVETISKQIHYKTSGPRSSIRVITNTQAPERDRSSSDYKEYPSGAYSFPFLDHFFGDTKYRVEIHPLFKKTKMGAEAYDPSENPMKDNVAIRWSTSDFHFVLRVLGNTGWLDSLNKIGLTVGNSKKMAKRLQELVRQTAAYMYAETLNIDIVNPTDLGIDDKEVDGISAISRSFAIKLFENNKHASREWIDAKIKDVKSGKTTVVSLRVLTPSGLIKGNAIIVKDEMINGYDIKTFTPNIKPELKTNGWYWTTIEPSYGRLPLKTDDLTLAIYHKVAGIIDKDLLLSTLKSSTDDQVDKMINGDPNDWLKQVIQNSEADSNDKNTRSTLKRIDQLVDKLEEIGLSIESSQLLMYLKANSFAMMYGVVDPLSQPVANKFAFKQDNGAWMPVPYGFRAHIMTKKALELFGFKFKNKSYEGFYHEESHCFVVPSEFFIANYENHGGFDLDDTINVMIRDFYTEDGQKTLCAFLLRNPNDFGEWSVIPVSPKEIKNCYHVYGEVPSVSWEELNNKVPQLSNLLASNMIQYKYEEMPGASAIRLADVYSPEDEKRNRTASMSLPGGTGATVLPKIIYYAILGTYLGNQLVSNEKLIDAVQQCMITMEDAYEIREASKDIYENISQFLSVSHEDPNADPIWIDSYWSTTRIPKKINITGGFQHFTLKNDESPLLVEFLHVREEMIRAKYSELLKWCNTPYMPSKLTTVQFTKEEMDSSAEEFNKLLAQYNAITSTGTIASWAEFFVGKLIESDINKGEEYTDRKILRLWAHAFAMKRVKPQANWDKWLFVVNANLDQLPMDWVVRAYKRIG